MLAAQINQNWTPVWGVVTLTREGLYQNQRHKFHFHFPLVLVLAGHFIRGLVQKRIILLVQCKDHHPQIIPFTIGPNQTNSFQFNPFKCLPHQKLQTNFQSMEERDCKLIVFSVEGQTSFNHTIPIPNGNSIHFNLKKQQETKWNSM